MHSRHAVGLLCLLATPGALTGQTSLQSPADFLGYDLGARFTPHHRVAAYFEHVARVVPNMTLRQYGETYEGRPLLLATISSAANMSRLDEIRENNLRRARVADGDASADETVIVWLSYNVHGNEAVSTEAAMATIYALADGTNRRTQAWLDNTVVLVDPAINPDGRDRYVGWYNQTVGRWHDVNPAAREHGEPWPGGRTNHYMFDLNRDWAWLVQLESQARLRVYQEWMPHVHVDFHEMGANSPYYFAPAAEPYHEDITAWQREFQGTIGRNHADYFDENGWLYFTREVYDLLYPSYGDTYPSFSGAIGMTYEQGGGGRAGLGIVKSDGDTLALADRIAHHYTTGLSTIETASRHAGRVVQEFARYFETAVTNPVGTYKTYVVAATNDAGKVADLLRLLDAHGIRYGRAEEGRNANGFDYATGQTGSVRVDAGDIVISAYQPKSTFVKVLFEPQSELADSLTYDITAWSLPYAYGLNAVALTDRIDPSAPVTAAPVRNTVNGTPYAYLARWSSFSDARLLAALLRRGVKVRFAQEPFETEGQTFARGTLVITRTGNESLGGEFDRIVVATANELAKAVVPVGTGFVSRGSDFGSSRVRFLDRPSVGLISGEGISSNAMGEVWHFFEWQLEYPVTLIDSDDVGNTDLSEFDVIILPNGSYGGILNGGTLTRLTDWVRFGGRLIALEGAVRFLAEQDDFAVSLVEDDEDEDEETDDLRVYADRVRSSLSENVPGAVYRLQLDNTHPLAFGYPDRYFTLKRSSAAYQFLEEDWSVGVVRNGGPVAGFVGSDARERLEDVLVFGVESIGGGRVVYMVDNPLFRGFWQNGKLLFGNAVFLVGQ